MTDRELMQQWMKRLSKSFADADWTDVANVHNEIKVRLAQPEQEPVAWMHPTCRDCVSTQSHSYKDAIPLYTAPPQREWQGLTDEEIMDACSAVWASHPIEVGQVVEAMLKEKNA